MLRARVNSQLKRICDRKCVLVGAFVLGIVFLWNGVVPCRVPRFIAVGMHSNNHQFTEERAKRANKQNMARVECGKHARIQMIAHATPGFQEKYEKKHIRLMRCYASRHDIPLLILDPFRYEECDGFNDVFFLRHCVTSLFLKCADYTFVFDLDVLPQNDLANWEPYLLGHDVVFSQVTEGGEIAAGTFLVRNTQYAREFLLDWASRENWQKCWNANGDQVPLHQLLMDRVRMNPRERAECDHLMEKQKWPYEVQQWIRCAVWWIRVGAQWSEHIYVTDMRDALTLTARDYNAENIIEEKWSPIQLPGMVNGFYREHVPLPISKHPFLHQIKPDVLGDFLNVSEIPTCDSPGWKMPWWPSAQVRLALPPHIRGA